MNGKDNIRRIVAVIIAGTLFFTAGCAQAGKDAVSSNEKLTRASYMGMLGDIFGFDNYVSTNDIFSDVSSSDDYYAQIQASAEWGVMESGGEFHPQDAATIAFAMESAVRAVGIDEIEESGESVDEEDLTNFYMGHIAKIDVSDLQAQVNEQTAGQILAYAMEYKNDLILPQKEEIEFTEAVKPAAPDVELNADGTKAKASESDGYKVGDIIFYEATDTSLPQAYKVTDVNGEELSLTEATIEETYQTINISGTYEGGIVSVMSASDQTIAGYGDDLFSEMQAYGMALDKKQPRMALALANGVTAKSDSKSITFTASADHATFSMGITDLYTTVHYESEFLKPLSPKVVDFSLHYNTNVTANVSGSVSKSIPLGEANIQIGGPVSPLFVRVAFTANLGADGEVTISYTTDNNYSAGWKKGTGLSKNVSSTSDASMEAQVTLTAEASGLVDLRIGYGKASESIVNAQATTGVVGVAKLDADLLGNQPTCIDVKIYVPLRWGVNQEGCILTFISDSLKYSATVWDSANSPIQLHFHFEDGARTPGDVCTREDEVEQELIAEDGKPLDELELFDFEKLDFDFIELSTSTIYLSKGETAEVPLVSLPDGYSAANLQYEVEDGSICSVSGEAVSAGEAGSTIIKIRTDDGMFAISLAVTVNEDFSMDFEPL